LHWGSRIMTAAPAWPKGTVCSVDQHDGSSDPDPLGLTQGGPNACTDLRAFHAPPPGPGAYFSAVTPSTESHPSSSWPGSPSMSASRSVPYSDVPTAPASPACGRPVMLVHVL